MRRYTSLLPPLVWLHFTVSNWLFSCLISVNTLWTIIKIQWLLISIQKSIMSESENSFLRNSHAKRPNTTIRTSLLDFVRRRPFYCTFCILYWITLTRNLGKNMHNSHINRTPPWQRNQTASLRLSAGTKQTAEENQNSPNGHLQKEKSWEDKLQQQRVTSGEGPSSVSNKALRFELLSLWSHFWRLTHNY